MGIKYKTPHTEFKATANEIASLIFTGNHWEIRFTPKQMRRINKRLNAIYSEVDRKENANV